MGAALVLFCLQESCCYVAILSMRALRPRFHATSGFFLNRRIEDETHFLSDCPSFSSIRDMFFSKLEPKIPFLRLQSHESLLSNLMNSTDYFINIQLNINVISDE